MYNKPLLMCHDCLNTWDHLSNDYQTAEFALDISGGNGCHKCDERLIERSPVST